MKTFKSIFKPVAIWLVAAVSFTACEVDTTTVMFEEDHNFSEPSDTVFSMLGIISKGTGRGRTGNLVGRIARGLGEARS